jgi:hypothetical protein
MSNEREALATAIEAIAARFRSGNRIPVDKATVPASEWVALVAALAQPVAAEPLDALRWGANVAETLLSIGRAIGFGRAQQILGEQWEAAHNCAPRGRMGVTARDTPDRLGAPTSPTGE